MGSFLRNYDINGLNGEQKDLILKMLKRYKVGDDQIKTSANEKGRYSIELTDISSIRKTLDPNNRGESLEQYLSAVGFNLKEQSMVMDDGTLKKIGKEAQPYRKLRDFKLVLESESDAQKVYNNLKKYGLNEEQLKYSKNDAGKIEIDLYKISPEEYDSQVYMEERKNLIKLGKYLNKAGFKEQEKKFSNEDYLNNVFEIKIRTGVKASNICKQVMDVLRVELKEPKLAWSTISAVIKDGGPGYKRLFIGIQNNAVNTEIYDTLKELGFLPITRRDVESKNLNLDFINNNIMDQTAGNIRKR